MSVPNFTHLLVLAINSAFKAGIIQKDIYSKDFDIEYKSDNSPVTNADKLSNEVIKDTLKIFDYPYLSEEDLEIDYNIRKKWNYYWIIDPLDGTKEFIKKNGEFSINIAFAQGNKVIFGVVYAPISGEIYFNTYDNQAYKSKINYLLNSEDFSEFIKYSKKLKPINLPDNLTIAASRSHLNEKTQDFISYVNNKAQTPVQMINRGSALKICLVAEGIAHIYPRFGPTSEWDTAAGHAIINAVGGKIINIETLKEIEYNRKNIINSDFIAYFGENSQNLLYDYLSASH